MFFSYLALSAGAGLAAAQCSRQMLQEATSGYLAAVAAGTPTFAALGTAKIEYVENGKDADIAKGLLSSAIRIDYNRSIFDTTLCASYTEIVSTDTKHPYVIGSRLAFGNDSKVARIDQNICDTGDWIFNAAGTLKTDQSEDWKPIPEAQRDTRETIQKVGDAYINGWGDASIKAPAASGCYSLEGGTKRAGCSLSFGQKMDLVYKRYTIDEELGAIDIFHNFPFLDKAIPRDPGTATNNLLKVEGGKIKFLHENTVCSKSGCAK
jgi:hypothetical protein